MSEKICKRCHVSKTLNEFTKVTETIFDTCHICRRMYYESRLCEHMKIKSKCPRCINPIKLRIRNIISATKQSDKMYRRYDADNHIDFNHVKELMFNRAFKCAFCHRDTQFETYNESLCTIDRIDNNIGHVKGNCTISCRRCNFTIKDKSGHPQILYPDIVN